MITARKISVLPTAAVGSTGVFADGHTFDVDQAHLESGASDRSGDDQISDIELIEGNLAIFDLDRDGQVGSAEHGGAE